jgi:hypothetical protein
MLTEEKQDETVLGLNIPLTEYLGQIAEEIRVSSLLFLKWNFKM